ncbi:unnamed protein product [Boreogadus saida]
MSLIHPLERRSSFNLSQTAGVRTLRTAAFWEPVSRWGPRDPEAGAGAAPGTPHKTPYCRPDPPWERGPQSLLSARAPRCEEDQGPAVNRRTPAPRCEEDQGPAVNRRTPAPRCEEDQGPAVNRRTPAPRCEEDQGPAVNRRTPAPRCEEDQGPAQPASDRRLHQIQRPSALRGAGQQPCWSLRPDSTCTVMQCSRSTGPHVPWKAHPGPAAEEISGPEQPESAAVIDHTGSRRRHANLSFVTRLQGPEVALQPPLIPSEITTSPERWPREAGSDGQTGVLGRGPLARECWDAARWPGSVGTRPAGQGVLGRGPLARECWDAARWPGSVGTRPAGQGVLGRGPLARECWDAARWPGRVGTRPAGQGVLGRGPLARECWDAARWPGSVGTRPAGQGVLGRGPLAREGREPMRDVSVSGRRALPFEGLGPDWFVGTLPLKAWALIGLSGRCLLKAWALIGLGPDWFVGTLPFEGLGPDWFVGTLPLKAWALIGLSGRCLLKAWALIGLGPDWFVGTLPLKAWALIGFTVSSCLRRRGNETRALWRTSTRWRGQPVGLLTLAAALAYPECIWGVIAPLRASTLTQVETEVEDVGFMFRLCVVQPPGPASWSRLLVQDRAWTRSLDQKPGPGAWTRNPAVL